MSSIQSLIERICCTWWKLILHILRAIDPSANPDGGDTLAIHVARDTATNIFHLVTCVYDKLYPKVFLVAADNVVAGLKKLESNDVDVTKSVTGGRVRQCGLLAYANGFSKS